jgi:phosphate transport system ATP-binding protein
VFVTKNVSIYYDSFKAVTDVSLTIYQNEITAFIGSSGSGKTTVLRAFNRMNDLVPGTRLEGEMDYRGESLYGPDVSPIAVRRRIGMVFQKPNPFPKSIYDNAAYGPRINGEHDKKKLDEIVERSLREAALWDEVKNRLNKSGLALSGGQAQRLCIARTIAVEPDVVLMDEPASALDPIATGRIEDLMREMRSRFTIVIVTHNMQQATRGQRPHRLLFGAYRQRERYPHRGARRARHDPADLRGPARPPHPGLRQWPGRVSPAWRRPKSTLAESVIGPFKTELIKPRGPLRTTEQVELAASQ